MSSPYSRIAAVVRPGEWTTYGDISAAVHTGSKRHARAVGRAAADDPEFPNAHRILAHTGHVVRNDAAQERRALRRLRAEGISLDESGRADPARRIHWDELQRRLYGSARKGAAR